MAAARFLIFLLLAAALVAPAEAQQSLIARGQALVIAADCSSCHTKEGGKPFAGGTALQTAFGTIYAPNITFDKDTGIGSWTEADFYSALHRGIDDEGNHLYPAMPYNYYTRLPENDVRAIYAYLKSLPPVHHEVKDPDLSWPFSWRPLIAVWNWLFFKEGEYRPDPRQSVRWNRGAFLVEALGHCGACHTPQNFLGAPQTSRLLQGNEFEHWFAPSLTGSNRDGLGQWTRAQIVQFLKTGGNLRTGAYGPMDDVISNSTSKMNYGDLAAIATYLKSLPPAKSRQSSEMPPGDVMRKGERIFGNDCAECHTESGHASNAPFASLYGNSAVQAPNPASIIHVILTGTHAMKTNRLPTGQAMPAFASKLKDHQIADVATYIRNAWGNSAPPVSEGEVSELRKAVSKRDEDED